MNIIEAVDGDLYAESADVTKVPNQDLYEAYLSLGHAGSKALVVRQRSSSEVGAVRALVAKLKAFMQLMEGATNDRFLPVLLSAMDDQMAEIKRALGGSPFDLGGGDDDKKDEPS
jgi:hypothetical protein